MYKLKDASENEMILLFLQTEIKSSRFKQSLKKALYDLKIDEKIVLNPNLNLEEENELRKKVLLKYRGYEENKDVFESFPSNIKWGWYSITKEELKKVKYINYDYWIELSNNTRLAIDAVKNIEKGIEVYGVSNKQYIDLAKQIDNEKVKLPGLIIVAPIEDLENMIVLEGHLRLTAYILAEKEIDNLKIMIGYAREEDLKQWVLF